MSPREPGSGFPCHCRSRSREPSMTPMASFMIFPCDILNENRPDNVFRGRSGPTQIAGIPPLVSKPQKRLGPLGVGSSS